MEFTLETSWKTRLADELEQKYFSNLTNFVKAEYEKELVYPPADKIFRAFDLCPFESVRVVILGQDPYHGPGQANGLCFSVSPAVNTPPSLVNIFKELQNDLRRPPQTDRTLESWARQGVLLLNSTLTVRSGLAASHAGHGWETFTEAALSSLVAERSGLVFFLWGSYAQKKGTIIDATRNLVIRSPHPSPLSAYRGFFGSKPFSQANEYLKAQGQGEIEW